ncbi:MAG: TRAP transporter large permease subunit [Alphaproteobacteria bacterium]|nr:TRAP transporter large permease subunit [Alphaproteobacteria bacterium]
MTDPQVAVFMLGIFVLTILLGFPICFTLMAMGVAFGYYAYYDAERMTSIFDNRIFDLLVNQTYSVMANDVLTAVPLFLFMGYIVERANIVDRLFITLQIAARRLPGSMAIAALATCALFATATGIIGAVVTLMGLLAFPAMLKARYDTSFAAGVICAGGCLGILIPPSIMLIVYSATSNVSVVQLYAGAIFPGFLLAGLYMVYVIGRAMLNPSLAPKPKEEEFGDLGIGRLMFMVATSFFPLAFLILSVLGAILGGLATPSEAAAVGALGGLFLAVSYRTAAIVNGQLDPGWLGEGQSDRDRWLQALGVGTTVVVAFYVAYVVVFQGLRALVTDQAISLEGGLFGGPLVNIVIAVAIGLVIMLFGDRVPLLARLKPNSPAGRAIMTFTGQGALGGIALGGAYMIAYQFLGLDSLLTLYAEFNPWALDVGFFVGAIGWFAWRVTDQDRLKESVYLTVRTSAMVCWLFVGSWTFSSVFSYLGGESLIEEVVIGMNLSPVMFLIVAQLIIFLLGWPLEWSEIIIIFVPIFLPLLDHFGINPLFFGILVALNLQTSFLTPPMAMAAYYLKGVAPPHVQLMEIFKGVLPFLSMVFIAMILLYVFPDIALGLPERWYGSR